MCLQQDLVVELRNSIVQISPSHWRPYNDLQTMELEEAEEKMGLEVKYLVYGPVLRLTVMYAGDGPWYQSLWCWEGRPYIKLWEKQQNHYIVVFLLPNSTDA